jgi:hypothetical protein
LKRLHVYRSIRRTEVLSNRSQLLKVVRRIHQTVSPEQTREKLLDPAKNN